MRPNWVEIDLDVGEQNVREIRRHLDDHGARQCRICAVVKADGYGHGAEMVARSALRAGADWLAVAFLEEALILRNRGLDAPILVLGWTPREGMEEAVEAGIALTVTSSREGRALAQVARDLGRVVPVHIKVDTGMGRLGFPADNGGVREVTDLFREPGLNVEGIFTHFSVADEDVPFTREQIRRYRRFVGALGRGGVQIPICHTSNSAGILDFPDAAFDMVRPGLMLYGVYPSDTVKRSVKVRPFLTWRARVAQVKVVPAGEAVSYGRIFIADGPVRIATLPVGYADGYPRGLSNRGEVLIRGRRCRIAGRVCMDQTMVIVPPEVGDLGVGTEAVLLGEDGVQSITVDEIALAMDTIPHEIFTEINKRVPRVFRWGGRVIGESEVLNV